MITARRRAPARVVVPLVLLGALLGVAGCGSSGSTPQRAAAPAPGVRAGMDPAVANAPGSGSDTSSPPVEQRSVVRTATVVLTVPDRAALGRQAGAVTAVATAAGGIVFAENRTETAATVVLHVPPATLGAVLARLASLGVQQSSQLSTSDVTGAVADVQARLTSARASLTRLQQLFGQAHTVSDVLAVENALAEREATLESLEAQQRVLAGQTGSAAVTVRYSVAAATAAARSTGFAAGLRAGWSAVVTGGRALLTAAGAALPFLPLVAVLALGLLVRRRRARRQTV